jgi:TRAP-type C4-dicarboxylate transport system permease small subunit
VRWVLDASDALLRMERWLLTFAMCFLTALILLNVVTRYSGMPLYWVDEAAVYTVVWLTFIGASVMTRLRLDFAVTMLTDKLSPRNARRAKVIATVGVLFFSLALFAMCWRWMDPIGIASKGFDAKEYAAESFNFLYRTHPDAGVAGLGAATDHADLRSLYEPACTCQPVGRHEPRTQAPAPWLCGNQPGRGELTC